MKKYVIVDVEVIEKRIEELKKLYNSCHKPSIEGTVYMKLGIELKQILSQSTPLQPELEKAFEEGVKEGIMGIGTIDVQYEESKNEYISNLKLDI